MVIILALSMLMTSFIFCPNVIAGDRYLNAMVQIVTKLDTIRTKLDALNPTVETSSLVASKSGDVYLDGLKNIFNRIKTIEIKVDSLKNCPGTDCETYTLSVPKINPDDEAILIILRYLKNGEWRERVLKNEAIK